MQKSFFEYIAGYRIDTAKDMLKNPQVGNLLIEEIAERVSHNSKSAFNNTLNKLRGMTSSEFRNS